MKITITTLSDKGVKAYDYRSFYQLDIESSTIRLKFFDGEPEDANLRRDFRDVYHIIDALRIAHAAGRRGEKIEIERIEVDNL